METVDAAAYAIQDWDYTGIRTYQGGPKCPKVPYPMAAPPRSGVTTLLLYMNDSNIYAK